MIRKPSPIHSLYCGFKHISAETASLWAALFVVTGLAFGKIVFFAAAAIIWCAGRSLSMSLEEEDRKAKMEEKNESSQDPPGSV